MAKSLSGKGTAGRNAPASPVRWGLAVDASWPECGAHHGGLSCSVLHSPDSRESGNRVGQEWAEIALYRLL
jgi:hypothetical protein